MANTIFLTPQKEYFIDMITRDIKLEDCIFELVDNALDGYLRNPGDVPEIIITFADNYFSIKDNCGGIPLEIAKDYAFNFGRKEVDFDINKINNSIGRFGIGMKRSIFKLGSKIVITTKSDNDSYQIEIDVPTWKKSDKWELEYKTIDGIDKGTNIEISNIPQGIRKIFKSPEFLNNMKSQLVHKFKNYIVEHKIKFVINYFGVNNELKEEDTDLPLLNNEIISPFIEEFELFNVKVKFVVGLTTRVEEGKYDPFKAGWYLYCNNRMVISADQSELTGWGSKGLSKFHVERGRRFRGYCYLNAEDSRYLPWNTTKTSVESESEMYVELRNKMIEHTKKFMSIAKSLEELDPSDKSDIEIMNEIETGSLYVSPHVETSHKSVEVVYDKAITSIPKKITISYKKNRDAIHRILKDNNIGSAADLGRITFDYYIDMEEIEWE